jgi:hypothetical protein
MTQVQWFIPEILATQEAVMGKVMIQGQPGKKFARLHLSQ